MSIKPERRPGTTIAEIAEDYTLSKSFLWKLARRGELPGCGKIGGKYIVLRTEFENFIKEGGPDQLSQD